MGIESQVLSLRQDELVPTRNTSLLPAQRVSCRLISTSSLPVISINIDVNATLTSCLDSDSDQCVERKLDMLVTRQIVAMLVC
jgi:hypothetical protein